ncbi:MAG: hypothetical protein PHQ43_11025, partial [Dehalococcoidales bacterium]|nr:hypothetical protein [Dehalococcoidales bacterium]
MGRLSLKAAFLYPLMWVNCDDQGRICGEPDEIKYAVCPNRKEISEDEIPDLLQEMEQQGLVKVYDASASKVIQMLDWWKEHRPQWAYPSEYPPPEGWMDRMRYHPNPKDIIVENWFASSQSDKEQKPKDNKPDRLGSALPTALPTTLPTTEAPQGSELARSIQARLLKLPEFASKLLEHEAIKERLSQLAIDVNLIGKEEVEVEGGRVDFCWQTAGNVMVAAFEIETLNPKGKSLVKLQKLQCKNKFIILRANDATIEKVGDITLIGLGRRREKLPSALGSALQSPPEDETEKEKEKEKEDGEGEGKRKRISPGALASTLPSTPGD